MWHLDSPIMLDKRINLYHPVPPGHVLGCHVRIPNNGINLVKIQHLKRILFTSNGSFRGKSFMPKFFPEQITDLRNHAPVTFLVRDTTLPDKLTTAFLDDRPQCETVILVPPEHLIQPRLNFLIAKSALVSIHHHGVLQQFTHLVKIILF